MITGSNGGPASLPTTDADALTRLERFGGRKLLDEMIALYLRSAPDRIFAAAAGLESGDAPAVENALHALKSSSAQLGAVRLSRLCEEGEAMARGGSLMAVAEVIDASREELRLVETWLDRIRKERRA